MTRVYDNRSRENSGLALSDLHVSVDKSTKRSGAVFPRSYIIYKKGNISAINKSIGWYLNVSGYWHSIKKGSALQDEHMLVLIILEMVETMTLILAVTAPILDTNLVITVHADGLTSKSARPSMGTVLTETFHALPSKFLWHPIIPYHMILGDTLQNGGRDVAESLRYVVYHCLYRHTLTLTSRLSSAPVTIEFAPAHCVTLKVVASITGESGSWPIVETWRQGSSSIAWDAGITTCYHWTESKNVLVNTVKSLT